MFDVAIGGRGGTPSRAVLREPCAREELLPVEAGPIAVTELIATLLVERPAPALAPDAVWKLPLGDRDRIVAQLHSNCFGDRIESIVTCSACRKQFEVGFSLAKLASDALAPPGPEIGVEGPDGEGTYTLPDGRRFRAPNTGDERAVAGLPIEQAALSLIERCLVVGDATSGDRAVIDQAMSDVAPVLDLDVPTTCALCGAEQQVHFDMVSFFLSALVRERPILLREVHRLAAAYHWSCEEIMALPRSIRRAHVALIEAERGGRRAAS
jgi:hypothetical protein